MRGKVGLTAHALLCLFLHVRQQISVHPVLPTIFYGQFQPIPRMLFPCSQSHSVHFRVFESYKDAQTQSDDRVLLYDDYVTDPASTPGEWISIQSTNTAFPCVTMARRAQGLTFL